MKRLTKKEQLAGHTVNYVDCDACFDVWSVPKKFMGNAIDRLAAYEDTKLEPEEIKSLQAEYAVNLKVLESYRSIGSVDRLRELAQTGKDGKIKAYIVDSFYCDICQKRHDRIKEIKVYLTRDAAEAALSERR